MRFTTLGTCRLADPLMTLSNSEFVRDQTNVYGYAHTAKEVIQQIQFIFGEHIPDIYAPYITSGSTFVQKRNRTRTDLWIIEISSQKEFILDNYYLQINYLARHFSKYKELLNLFWRYPRQEDLTKRHLSLKAVENLSQLSEDDLNFLFNAYVVTTTEASLREDMEAIVKLLPGQIVFVPHVNVPTNNGSFIARRVELNRFMYSIACTNRYNLFDPAIPAVQFGVNRAMMNNGSDLNHYSPEFTEYLGSLFKTTVLEPARASKKIELNVGSSTTAERSLTSQIPEYSFAG